MNLYICGDMMEKKSDHIFSYPPNLQELDLATLVNLYRERGEILKARAGNYVACAITKKLLKEAKSWFGLFYSQGAWDSLLTKSSDGYPLTEAEMNALGLVYSNRNEPPHREFVEKNIGVLPKLAYLIINDIKQFGFIKEDENGFLMIAPSGEKALQGIAKHMYGKPFTEEMLISFQQAHDVEVQPKGKRKSAARQKDADQTSLF
ncbi:hypothetical protein [Rhodohalobacter sp. 8-1]|uniref:hypothetical protein n=1 Tax=Rhodohalobacter sp. 8-1 TaxID=3131972 RepID=UPI0030EEA10A